MNRIEFMTELAILLQDIPVEERNAAMQYYNDYFDDAGSDKEADIIEKLGSPEKIANEIKANLHTDEEAQEYRETGYTDTRFEQKEAITPFTLTEDFRNTPKTHISKKGFKILLGVIGGIILLLCIFGIFVGYISNTFLTNYAPATENVTSSGNTLHHDETFNGVKSINVEASALNLHILASETNESSIKVMNWNDSNHVKFYLDHSTLNIETPDNWNNKWNIPDIRLYIPSEHFDEIEVDIDAGSIYIQDLSSVNSLDLHISAGEIQVDHFIANEAEFSCDAGTIDASGYCSKEIGIDCSTGSVALDILEKQDEYNYDVECGLGSVTIGNLSFSGNVEKESHTKNASKEISVECGLGEVTVHFTEE